MLNLFKQLTILDKVFNVHGKEWHKVSVAWAIRFLYRAGFVVGWTVIVALFVSRYGIVYLPYLFVANAILTIVGSFIYSNFLDRYSSGKIMILTIFLSGIFLFGATNVLPFSRRGFLFLLLFVESTFLIQFRILLNSYIEKMFTPLESERTFPLIESSDTLGGILAGLLIVLLSNSIEVYKFVYIWIGLLFLLVPAMLYYESYYQKISLLRRAVIKKINVGLITKFKTQFNKVSHVSFIKGLFVIIFFQWFLFNLLEFQYTSAVYSNIAYNVVREAGSGLEHTFVHDLGALFMFFSLFALLIQLFVGSRLINSLGVIGSMLLHPIVTLFSLVGLLFNFGFSTAVLAKNNFTITSIISNNAYHTSFYAVKEKYRDYTRELLEGIIRPIGAIAGTIFLILFQQLFSGYELTFYTNVLMVVIALLLFYVIYTQQDKYTDLAIQELSKDNEKSDRLNAIDILSQKGHKLAIKHFVKILREPSESISIRVKVLQAFGELQELNTVTEILRCFGDNRAAIREAAVDSLLKFNRFIKHTKSHLYLRLKIVGRLKSLCENEKQERIRLKTIKLLSYLSDVSAIEFLTDIIDGHDSELKAEAIYTLGNYNDPDVVKIIFPYLKSKNIKYQINAAISLGRTKKYLNESFNKIDEFFKSFDDEKVSLALFAIGELKLRNRKKDCLRHLYSHSLEIKLQSALSLGKMGYYESVPTLIDLLFHEDKSISKRVKRLLETIDFRVYKNIDKIVKHIVNDKIENFIDKSDENILSNLSLDRLIMLKWFYLLAEEYDEVENINNILNQ